MKWQEEADRFLLRFNVTPRPEMRVTAVESAPLIDLPAGGGNKSMNSDAAEIAVASSPTDDLNIAGEDGPMSQEDTFADIPFADDEEQAAKDVPKEEEGLQEQGDSAEELESGVVDEPSCDESRNGTSDGETPTEGGDDESAVPDEDKVEDAEEVVEEPVAEEGQVETCDVEGVEECVDENTEVTSEEVRPATECDKDEYAEDAEVVGSGLSDDEEDDDDDDEDEDRRPPPTILVSPPNPPKGILKKTSSQGKKGRRIVFNEMMTVFCDDCPEMQVPAFRPWDLTYSEMCFMYEPPPEYQDWLPFDPPAEYQDSEGFAPLWTRHQLVTSAFCSNGRLEDEESEREMCTDFSEVEDDSTANSESLPTDEVTTDLNDNIDDPVTDDPNANETIVLEEQNEDITIVQNDISGEETTSDNTEVSDDPSSETTTEVPFADFQDESKGLDLDLTSSADGDLVRTNSQIRKNIEINALRRSLLRGAEVRRRNAGKRPKSPTVSLSSLEEKLRWLTATDDEDDVTVSEASANGTCEAPVREVVPVLTTPPVVSEPIPVPNCVPRKPQRWASEVLYPSPAPHPQPPPTSQYFQLSNNKQPPSRPSSFDPSMSRIAWEALFQRDERFLHGSTMSLRNPYARTTEKHPNAANRPQEPWTQQNSHVVAFRKSEGRAPTSDELECFVQQDLERIERIKKRYSLTEDDDPTFGFGRRPSVRGIRPRFGSTTEILKQLQSQMQPPSLASPKNVGSHVTWPYPDVQKRGQPPQQQQQQHHHYRSVVVLPQVNEEDGAILHHRSAQCLRIVDPRRTKGTLSPCAVPVPPPTTAKNTQTKDERGTPEGASSSPKISSDSLYHHHHHHHQHQAANSTSSPTEAAVIYYSMNV